MGLHVQAQKFLDFYYQGSVVSSVNASDIDSMVIGTNPTNRTVDLYKNGDIFHSTTAARVDSVKVFKPENAPLVYLGIIGFNQELYKKEFGILSTSTASGFNTFVGNLTRKDGTLLYYGVDKALDMLKSTSFPTQVSSVNLITFTDGLDQGSMMMNGSYTTDEQYLNAVHQLIVNTRVKGLPLTAYSLGLKGSDVTNYTLFQNNLTKLASSSDKAIEVSSMSAVRTRLQEISDQIISISNKQTVSMKIPGPSNGTIIRFTFDNATAANSSMYIEGTFNLSDRSLRNVKYYGIKGGSGTIVQGKQEGIFVTYTFSGLQRTDGNGLIPVNSIREFYRSSTTNTWQENSEFTPANNTQTNITHSGAIILLVLDCSSSLGSQFSNMKSYAQDFITRVANNAEPYERLLSPTNVKASIDENDLVVNVSWNGVKYAESYNVYRSSSSNGTYELVAEGVTSTTWTDDSPLEGNNYYKVCAEGYGFTSSQSSYSYVNVSLAAPTHVKAVMAENDLVVNVSWETVKYAQSYNVYRSDSKTGMFVLVAENVTSTYWKDRTPLSKRNYYKVSAFGNGMESIKGWAVPAVPASEVQSFAVDGVTFTMIKVTGGTFKMGSDRSSENATPIHDVTLSDYYIGENEVTQELWQVVMGYNPSYHKGSKRPVDNVSWQDCQTFIKKLNELTGHVFRLPTEAEWEFAAKGGIWSEGFVYSGSNDIDNVAWYGDGSGYYETKNVGTKAPNELGIYDMTGNVKEYCQDWYGNYSDSHQINPTGPMTGYKHILRGGYYANRDYACTTTFRNDDSIGPYGVEGLRIVSICSK